MQYVTRYHLKPNTSFAYRQWILANRNTIVDNAPEGWKYLGTWFTVRSFGRFQCVDRWEIEDYSALGAGFGNEVFQNLYREAMEKYFDLSRDAEAQLLKSAEDVSIFE